MRWRDINKIRKLSKRDRIWRESWPTISIARFICNLSSNRCEISWKIWSEMPRIFWRKWIKARVWGLSQKILWNFDFSLYVAVQHRVRLKSHRPKRSSWLNCSKNRIPMACLRRSYQLIPFLPCLQASPHQSPKQGNVGESPSTTRMSPIKPATMFLCRRSRNRYCCWRNAFTKVNYDYKPISKHRSLSSTRPFKISDRRRVWRSMNFGVTWPNKECWLVESTWVRFLLKFRLNLVRCLGMGSDRDWIDGGMIRAW